MMMAAIYDRFSERNLGDVLARVFGDDPHVMLDEAINARSKHDDSDEARTVRMRLMAHGFDFDE